MADRDAERDLRRLAPLDPRAADQAWLFYLSGVGAERDVAADLLDVLLFQQASKTFAEEPFLDPPAKALCEGEYRLGVVAYPPATPYGWFGLREGEWSSHVMIVGMTGAGKTTLAVNILHELDRHGKPFLVLDWKQTYRGLRLPRLTVLTLEPGPGQFRFNPLIPPPGVSAGEWLMKLVDVVKHAYFVGEGVEYLLRRGMDLAYENAGWHAGNPRRVPMFEEIRAFVLSQRLQGRMGLWKASALRVLESLCFRHGLGPVVNTEETIDESLLSRPVVLELDALADADKVFLTEALVLWLYERRKREPKSEGLKHVLLIEEAHHVLSDFKERHEGAETVMETCLRQIREFGEGLIVVDQEPSKLSQSIKANTHTKVVFTLGHVRDLDEMAGCLGLDRDAERYLHLLKIGEAVVTVKNRMPRPVLVRFPYTPIDYERSGSQRGTERII